ncbi:hypothetical protein JCM10213v2_008367 [Rhodosporidiobolus nylandii]
MVKIATAATAAALVGVAAAQQINTPTALYTCQPYVRVLQGGTTSDVIDTLVSNSDVTSYSWNVNVAAGTSVTLGLTDSTGTSAYTAEVTVMDGGDSSCVGNSAAAASGSSGSSSAPAATSASSAASAASSSATSLASSASSVASSAASRATNGASSVASKASSAASSATSAAASAAASGNTSGAASLAVSGVLGVAALGAALMA